MDTIMSNQRHNGPPQQQQQPQQQPPQGQPPFQGSFNCYEAFPATSPPDAQFYQQQQQQQQQQATNPNAFLPQQPQQQTSSSQNQTNDELAGYMAIGGVVDPQQQQQIATQQPQTQATQGGPPPSLQQPQTQPSLPPPQQIGGGGYYYYQPTLGPISNNQSAFGFQSNIRPLPSGNHQQMSAIQPQLPEQSMQSQFMQPMPSHGALIANNQQQQQQKRKEIYRYTANHELYSCAWSMRPEPHLKFRIAVGSFIEEYNNKISIVQLREEQGDFLHIGTFEHPYPATKVLWIPDPKGIYPDLMATTGDYLRLWRVGGHHGASLEVMLNNNRTSDYCAPLTSSDWNETDVSLIGTSSIDTTCTIWQIETGQAISNTSRATEGTVKTQLIAHDKEVYDIAFSKLGTGREIFASVGADGSVRMFDLRHMEYSTIVFEEPNRKPLLRLAWNKQDHNHLATFAKGSNEVHILDIRVPSMPIATLKNHTACISGLAWAPHSSVHICTAGDDSQALIWDLHNMPRPIEDPILAYAAGGEINHVEWSTMFTDWISICYGNYLELLRV